MTGTLHEYTKNVSIVDNDMKSLNNAKLRALLNIHGKALNAYNVYSDIRRSVLQGKCTVGFTWQQC